MVAPARNEAEIIEACRAGDTEAVEAFVSLHQRAIWRVAWRLVGRRAVAEEIAQETFVRAFRQIDRIDTARGAQAWLLRTAVNLCRDHARQAHRHEASGPIAEEAVPLFVHASPDPEEAAALEGLKRRLAGALVHLSPKLREVVVLHYIEDLPFHEIARIVGAPITTLKVRALRARLQLRALIEEKR